MCTCGAVLVEEINEDGVRLVGAEDFMTFRRTTDYIMCTECLESFGVRQLIAKARGSDVIDLLERMAARAAESPAD